MGNSFVDRSPKIGNRDREVRGLTRHHVLPNRKSVSSGATPPWAHGIVRTSGCVLGSREKHEPCGRGRSESSPDLMARLLTRLDQFTDPDRAAGVGGHDPWPRIWLSPGCVSYLCCHIMAFAAFSAPRDSNRMHIKKSCISRRILDANPLGNILRPWIEHTASCQQIHMSPSECWSALAHKPLA